MNRRNFLRILGLSAPVMAASPKYFLSPKGGWTYTTPTIVPSGRMVKVWLTSSMLATGPEITFSWGQYENLVRIAG